MGVFKTTSVFSRNLHAYVEKVPIIINQGGTRSSKSYSIMQLLLLIAIKSSRPLVISVVSYALPHLKLGVMRDFDRMLVDYGINPGEVKNISESFYKINGTIIEFFGVDNVGKVHGPERDILFCNECNFIKHSIWEQLLIRTRGTVFADYNPSQEFWMHSDILNGSADGCTSTGLRYELIKSTYRDNEHLTDTQVSFIESKKLNKAWWKVYGEGELGQLEGAVFTNWRYGEFDRSLPHLFGQDYGFSNDPTTLVDIAIDRKKKIIYCDERVYSTELRSTSKIAQVNKAHAGKNLIVGDSAEGRLIYELRTEHGNNIRECTSESKKSVAARLMRLLDYELVITESSYNLVKELNYYTWIDKKGKLVIDDFNHLIDPIGYAFDFFMQTSTKGRTQAHVPKG